MTIYNVTIQDIPTGLDEVGYQAGLPRLPQEPSSSYRRRLLSFVRNRPRPDGKWYAAQASNLLGLSSINVLDIDLILDSEGIPLAADPRVEITATRLKLWEDFSNNVLEKDIELTKETKTLQALKTEIDTSSFFTCSSLDSSLNRYLCKNIRVSDSDGWKAQELLSPRKVHKFAHPYIVSIWPDITGMFLTEVNTRSEVNDFGKYYLNSITGVVHTYQPMAGNIKYQYRDFPFRLWWDPVRITPLIDADFKELSREASVDQLGSIDFAGGLTDYGAKLYRELLGLHALEWGE
jgi:hypothetical protein